jgi:hypothetical protein
MEFLTEALSAYVSMSALYILFLFCGYAPKVLLLDGGAKRHDVCVAPWLGFGLASVSLWIASNAGFSVHESAPYFMAAVTILNAAVFFRTREGICAERREFVPVMFAALCFAVLWGSVLAAAGEGVLAAAFSWDLELYANAARSALVSSARSLLGELSDVPVVSGASLALNYQLRGCVYPAALFAAITGADVARSVYLFLVFGMFLVAVTFRIFLRGGRPLFTAAAVSAWMASNTFFQWAIYAVFMGQTYSIGYTLLAVYFGDRMSRRPRLDLRGCALMWALVTSCGVNYAEGMPYAVLPLMAYGAVAAVRRSAADVFYLKNMFITAGFYAATNFYVLWRLIQTLALITAQEPGWPMPLATLYDLSGLYFSFGPAPARILLMITANVAMLEMIMRRAAAEGRKSFMTSCCVNCFLVYIFFCLWYYRPGELTSYNPYKAALSMSYIAVIMIIRFANAHARGALAKVAFAAVLALSLVGAYRGNSLIRDGAPYVKVTRAHAEFGEKLNLGGYGAANFFVLNDAGGAGTFAPHYLPFGRSAVLGTSAPGAPAAVHRMFAPGDVLVSGAAMPEIYENTAEREIFANAAYRARELSPGSIVLYDMRGLGRCAFLAASPAGPVAAREITDNRAVILFASLRAVRADFSASLYIPGAERRGRLKAYLFVNGKRAGRFNAEGEFSPTVFRGVEIREGINEFEIIAGGIQTGDGGAEYRRYSPPGPEDKDCVALYGLRFAIY